MAEQQDTHLRKIALIGGTGNIGSHILKHLLATNKHHVTVLTRPDSTSTPPPSPNLTITKVDYSSHADLIAALSGHDFLIITLTARAPPDLHASIVRAAADAGVRTVMPNYFGYGLGERGGTLLQDPILGRFNDFINDVKSVDGVDYVALVCGFWYEFSLAMGTAWLGFDITKRSVTFYDEGTTRINTSTWEQCGRAVAGLLSLPSTEMDKWRNEGLYVSSFLVSQREILDSLHRVLGTKDEDWTIAYEPAEERYRKGLEELQAGDQFGFAKLMYARLFFKSGDGDYETGQELDNAKLGLPKEDLDEATRRAVGMRENGMGF